MKRILLITIICLSLLLVGCNDDSPATTATEPTMPNNTEIEPYTPTLLFSIAKSDLKKEFQTLFYPLGKGITYVTETEKGYTFGYFEFDRSVLSEDIFTDDNFIKSSFSTFVDDDKFSLYLTNSKIHFASLLEGSSQELYDSQLELINPIIYNSIKIIYENDDYVLLAPIDLSTQYVLAEKSNLDNFSRLLCADEESNLIFYATSLGNGYSGFSSFKYGEAAPREHVELCFDEYVNLGDCKLLFYKKENNLQTFTYYNMLTGESKSYSWTLKDIYYSFSADKNGKHLIAYTSSDNTHYGGYIDIIDLEDSVRIKRIALEDLQTNPNICITSDGKHIIYSNFTSVSGKACEQIYFIKLP